ncbi:MAG: T9SS type A sorting domain-containing protein [bacterium]|nr:T9SS type A sorting domain-containing protein [bacterium]
MKTIYNNSATILLQSKHFNYGALVLLIIMLFPGYLFSQQSYTFTSAGATGSVGPTQIQLNSAYLSTNLSGAVVASTTGIQTWTVPNTSNYLIDIMGSAGGECTSYSKFGGSAARMQGEFNLTAGTVVQILIGQKGENGCGCAGGGGGTYVVANGTLLIAAGGGGGCSSDQNGVNGATVTTGTQDFPAVSLGGSAGTGGQSCQSGSYNAGGGGGFLIGLTGNGQDGSSGGGGGKSFLNGGTGGFSFAASGSPAGGFGGGGGGRTCTVGGGGAGGYSGGAGGQHLAQCANNGSRTGGGGGGSYNTGANQVNTPGYNTSAGRAVISGLCNVGVYGVGSNSVAPAICNGSSITLTTNAVSSYTWSNGNTTNTTIVVTPSVTTTYSIIGTSSANCVASGSITVIVNPGVPVLSISNPSNAICLGRTVSLTATGALSYTWSGGVVNGQTFTPVSTQNYTVTGQNGCGITTAVTTITVAALSVSALASQTLVCMGFPSTLTAVSSVGGYTWQPAALFGSTVVVAPMANTIYTVTASDGTCSGTQTLALTTKVTPTISVSASSTLICQGQSAVLTAGGGSTYNWTPGNLSGNTVTVSPITSTLYVVNGTNSLNCTSSANQVIIVNASPTLNIAANKTTVCAGDAVYLFASGATTYTWTNGPSTSAYTVTPTSSTVYTVSGNQGTNICAGSTTIAITAVISNVSVSSNTSVCPGGSATLTASGATTYTWNGVPMAGNGNFQVSPSGTTIYTCVANTTSGSVSCPTTKTVQVAIFPNPTITVVATKSLICKAQSNTLTASGAITYSWGAAGSGSSVVVKPNSTTIYSVSAIDVNGCLGSKLITVQVNACAGIAEDGASSNYISIYPNPSMGDFTIETTTDIVLRLMNNIGQQLRVISLTEANEHKANVKDLANGVYFLVGENAVGKVNQKIVVAK